MPNSNSINGSVPASDDGRRAFDPLVDSQDGVRRSMDAAGKFLDALAGAVRGVFSKERPVGYNFIKYDNEPLNSRVDNPSLNGNILSFVLDGKERRFTVPEQKLEAMRQGYLPQNALINRIVDKVDAAAKASEAAAANYEAAERQHRPMSRFVTSMHM